MVDVDDLFARVTMPDADRADWCKYVHLHLSCKQLIGTVYGVR
jgi:hypothetical protein